jgi:hypothetical protein
LTGRLGTFFGSDCISDNSSTASLSLYTSSSSPGCAFSLQFVLGPALTFAPSFPTHLHRAPTPTAPRLSCPPPCENAATRISTPGAGDVHGPAARFFKCVFVGNDVVEFLGEEMVLAYASAFGCLCQTYLVCDEEGAAGFEERGEGAGYGIDGGEVVEHCEGSGTMLNEIGVSVLERDAPQLHRTWHRRARALLPSARRKRAWRGCAADHPVLTSLKPVSTPLSCMTQRGRSC